MFASELDFHVVGMELPLTNIALDYEQVKVVNIYVVDSLLNSKEKNI